MRVCERPREYEATFSGDGSVTVTDAFGKSEKMDRDTFHARFCARPANAKVPSE